MNDSNDDRRDRGAPDADTGGDPGAGNERPNAVDEIDSGTGAGDRPDDGHDPRDPSTQVANEERRRDTPIISAVIAAIGAWVAISVLLFDVGEASLWNNVLVGAIVFLAAGYNVYRIQNDIPISVGVSSLLAVLGIWLIVSAALLGMLGSLFWSTLASGLLVAGLAGYNAYEAREARTVATEPETGT
ncbi:SPW repeat domain-containing protein [Natrarchaeobius chitinivorans]|uniref:SPW repeat-containing integral membrane domain-containing protein n=1 Tax=Natrarchaeobius chitinivorans TaxID=1679083 RepID=A0A3N6PI02_NATCH|nr:hypothetical protein [Natrarchaeobius chitinivorans]RQG97805.1 hypothetical protein EA473_00940 [Natrarchaeobius chitinivorans]